MNETSRVTESASQAYRIALQHEIRLLEEEIERQLASTPEPLEDRPYRLLGQLPSLVRTLAAAGGEAREELRELRQAVPQLEGTVRDLERLSQLSRQINATLEVDEILTLLVALTAGVVDNEGGIVYLHEAATATYQKAITHRLSDEALRAIEFSLDHGILENIDTFAGPTIVPEIATAMKAGGAERSLIIVPLRHRERPVGLMVMLSNQPRLAFFQGDLDLLGMLANTVSVAIGNALLFDEVKRLAVTDDLTQLANSRHLGDYLGRMVGEAERKGERLSLLFMDLDGFKQINDQHGHKMGSAVLQEVAGILRGCVGGQGLLARFGGDEFVVVMPRTEAFSAFRTGEAIRSAVAAYPFLATQGIAARLTISVGVATYPDHARSVEELVSRADAAMYVVKNAAKDGVSLASARSA